MAIFRENTLGILGGMGPLATAKFIQTIYEFNPAAVEQSMPRVLADCDPGLLPDRTQAIRGRYEDRCATLLDERLQRLSEAGATSLVLACMTAHHFLDRVSLPVRARVISLVSVAMHSLAGTRQSVVLLATLGTREARIFERAPGWPEVADRVVLPGPADQELVHDLVYRIKQSQATPGEVIDVADQLCKRYDSAGVVLGCTEFHLHSQALTARYGPQHVVDPLRDIAADLPRYLRISSPVEEGTRC